jgi:hypothetical protein
MQGILQHGLRQDLGGAKANVDLPHVLYRDRFDDPPQQIVERVCAAVGRRH